MLTCALRLEVGGGESRSEKLAQWPQGRTEVGFEALPSASVAVLTCPGGCSK